MFDKNHDVEVLNSLAETTLDSVDGYRRSAQEATDSRFASEFQARASEREQVVASLQNEVRRLGGSPQDEGSILAAAHRMFLTIRDRATGADDNAVLAEVDHGETYLDGKWQTALSDEKLSGETRTLIQQLYDSVRSGRQRWQEVHRSYAAAS